MINAGSPDFSNQRCTGPDVVQSNQQVRLFPNTSSWRAESGDFRFNRESNTSFHMMPRAVNQARIPMSTGSCAAIAPTACRDAELTRQTTEGVDGVSERGKTRATRP